MTDFQVQVSPIVWTPSKEIIAHANLTRFMARNQVADFSELMERSTRDVGWFTEALFQYLDIRFEKPYTQVVDLSKGIAWPAWCVGGKLNIVQNCLDKYMGTPTEHQTALIWEGEEGATQAITYGDLWRRVNQAANALRALGIGKGDAVGIYMPMVPEIVVALLAIAKIGGIILPMFSGYGAGALVTRLQDAQAKALFTSDGAYRRGRPVPMKPVADDAAEQCPSLKYMIVYSRLGIELPMRPGRDYAWEDLVLSQPTEAATEPTSAEDPLMLIYTSGTTGRPKGAVHTHCGFPIKAAQDMAFGTDVHPGDRIYWFTDMGWMMGPWLVFGSLILGATSLIFDGAPDFPHPDRLWALIERHKINQLGISPTLIRSLIAFGENPILTHDLSSLRLVASTGEPWNPDPWNWLFETVGKTRLPIINYSGGTECGGGILMGNPLFPIKPTSIPAPCPGMAVDVLDEQGRSVRGQVGELVVKTPWIGMTRGFWNDPQRYLDTYWSRWPDTWVHGDWALVDEDGQWYVLGRSDDTIKIAGKRLGPAEVESILVSHPGVLEAAAIGVPDELKGSSLVVFCVLRPGTGPTAELREDLTSMVIRALGKPLAPKEIVFIHDLPKTRNAKVMRRMIRSAYLDLDPGDTSALVNPETIEEIREVRAKILDKEKH